MKIEGHVALPNGPAIHSLYCDKTERRIIRSPLMKTLDWSVKALDRECNSIGLCIYLNTTKVASETNFKTRFTEHYPEQQGHELAFLTISSFG